MLQASKWYHSDSGDTNFIFLVARPLQLWLQPQIQHLNPASIEISGDNTPYMEYPLGFARLVRARFI